MTNCSCATRQPDQLSNIHPAKTGKSVFKKTFANKYSTNKTSAFYCVLIRKLVRSVFPRRDLREMWVPCPKRRALDVEIRRGSDPTLPEKRSQAQAEEPRQQQRGFPCCLSPFLVSRHAACKVLLTFLRVGPGEQNQPRAGQVRA